MLNLDIFFTTWGKRLQWAQDPVVNLEKKLNKSRSFLATANILGRIDFIDWISTKICIKSSGSQSCKYLQNQVLMTLEVAIIFEGFDFRRFDIHSMHCGGVHQVNNSGPANIWSMPLFGLDQPVHNALKSFRYFLIFTKSVWKCDKIIFIDFFLSPFKSITRQINVPVIEITSSSSPPSSLFNGSNLHN